MSTTLRYKPWWMTLGWLMVAFVIALSLTSVQGPVSAPGFDKVYHAIAYGAMMFWWGMVQPQRRTAWMLILIAMGIGLEIAQSFTGYRQLDQWDVMANCCGVIAALLLLLTPLAGLLPWFDRQLADRLNTGAA